MIQFKDDAMKLCQTSLVIPEFLYKTAMHLINKFDSFEKYGSTNDSDDRPTVLVYLPGIHEIVQMETILKDQWNSL